jgi:(2Fe-2S) ferredoxin
MEEMKQQPYERIIFVCANQRDPGEAACLNRGSGEFQKQLKEYQKSKNIKGLRVSRSLCLGLCEKGPNICIMPENVWYTGVTPKDLDEIKSKWIDPLAEKKPT